MARIAQSEPPLRTAPTPPRGAPGWPTRSFDIVSKVDRQEVDNALNQAAKEISQRYDFKNVGASIAWSGEKVAHEGELARSGSRPSSTSSRRSWSSAASRSRRSTPASPRRRARSTSSFATLKEGISQENAKKIGKIIRDEGPKSVKVQVAGRRAAGLLQEPRRPAGRPARCVKGKDLDFALQFVNYR